jgi:GTP-binding protein EngB required for normal cell division
MGTLKTLDLPNHIQELTLCDKDNLSFDYQNNSHYWMTETEEEYKKVLSKIDKLKMENKTYLIYAWYDISSFDYWKRERDTNYIQLTVVIKKPILTNKQIYRLENDLNKLDTKACIILSDIN